ncbi:hypothetical protein GALL_397630 [mine drainage metagenome]|uniref:DUF4396 domain-containing protein n=1 Tax=mine drainage metagenome TaxID=410659 RepID=A0A1J5Q4D1_9ZZZZ
MIDVVILLWFILTALSVIFVVIDIRSTPASRVLKWVFILLVAYTGVFGAFLYVLGCREPLPGTHEQYVAARWRQVLGSTMHCVAGDGIGILAGAVISSVFVLHGSVEIALEYILGFAFGWTIFQALFMRGMAGGSYTRSLTSTFIPELLSMNLLMAGMVPMMTLLRSLIAPTAGPDSPSFWFVMSMALLTGFIVAYPMNWWLVANKLKHGMITVRRSDLANTGADIAKATSAGARGGDAAMTQRMDMDHGKGKPVPAVPIMALLSFIALSSGLVIAWLVMAS